MRPVGVPDHHFLVTQNRSLPGYVKNNSGTPIGTTIEFPSQEKYYYFFKKDLTQGGKSGIIQV